MAAMETPRAIQPDLATMLKRAGVRNTAVAVAAVMPMLPAKYTEIKEYYSEDLLVWTWNGI